jgi:APA family basic amino acid/polyamine antiporter
MTATLPRKLGLWTSVSIVVGSVVGSSIFMKPAVMAQQLPSPLLLFGVWVLAGGVSLIGAMINSEVASIYPETGGQYVFFRRLYGRFFSFLFGWASFTVINTAAVAAIAFVFAQFSENFVVLPRFAASTEQALVWSLPFLGKLYPLQNAGVKALAILLIVAVTSINVRSVRSGGAAQILFTALKIGALLLLLYFLFAGNGSLQNVWKNPASSNLTFWPVIFGVVAAMSGALASYDGWNNLSFIAGEIEQPQKNIPRSYLAGLGVCLLLYILTTLAYLYVIPVDEMQHSTLVAADAVKRAGSAAGSTFVSLLVMISCAGAVNGNVMPCARLNFAMAEDGCFFKTAAAVHPRFRTPANALWMQCGWSCLFVISGSFDMLADLFVFVTWIFYGFVGYAIFIIRRRGLKQENGFRMWGYPLLPVLFIAFAVLYFGMTIYNDVQNYRAGKTPVINSLLGLLLVLTGVPFYAYFKKSGNAGQK